MRTQQIHIVHVLHTIRKAFSFISLYRVSTFHTQKIIKLCWSNVENICHSIALGESFFSIHHSIRLMSTASLECSDHRFEASLQLWIFTCPLSSYHVRMCVRMSLFFFASQFIIQLILYDIINEFFCE